MPRHSIRQPSRTPVGSGFGEFFRYHGWLAPGVRLFRNIGFPAKAIWIALAFLVPLGVMLTFLWRSAQEQIQTAQSERLGLTYERPLLELIAATQERRQAAMTGSAELGSLQQKVRSAYAKVQARHDELGAAFADAQEYAALATAHQALLESPVAATPDETFQRHAAFVGVVLKLVTRVADGSTLMLDPDTDTFHMMNMSVLRGPIQIENTARLAGLGSLVLQSKEMTRQRRDLVTQCMAVWEYLDTEVENSYRTGIESSPELKPLFDMKGTDAASDALREAVTRQLLGPALAGDVQAFNALAATALSKQVELVTKVMARLDVQLQQRSERLWSTLSMQLGMAAVFVLLAAYLMLAFYKVMKGGLQEVSGHLKQITQGNLTTAPRPWGKDEAAQLMTTLGEMQASLRRIVGVVLDGAAGVQSASAEISAATQDLSRRTEMSAASLQQTAASTEEISSTVKHTADTVDGAMAIVRDNAAAATRGGEVISQVVHTMQDISASSSKIGEIIGVIEGIAFQTNILALNAAVEAARAGEQGRGFAVVATEVRALAGRSSAAAKEIKSLISASIDKVHSGTKVVADAGHTIGEIVSNAEKIESLMKEISTATREQSTGVGQVGSAVHELDQSTQQNAALVEQTAAATTALSEQAQRLADEVGFFRVQPQLHGA